MATRRYKISAGENEFAIVEDIGAATNSDTVELTVDLSTSAVNSGGTTRAILKSEVLLALSKIENWITKGNWPPA